MAADLFIPDDHTAGHGARISASDGSVLSTPTALAPAERGDCLASGIFCLAADTGTGSSLFTAAFVVYDANYTEIGRVTSILSSPSAVTTPVRAIRAGTRFYVLNGRSVVYTISNAAVLGGTSWTLPNMAGGFRPTVIGVSQDETTLYYGVRQRAGASIQTWDLVNDVAGADFAAAPSGDHGLMNDILTLASGRIAAVWSDGVGDVVLKIYNADGSERASIALTTDDDVETVQMCPDLDDDTYLWARTFDVNGLTSYLTRYSTVDGSVSRGPFQEDFDTSEGGAGVVPDSCPLMMLTSGGGGGGTTARLTVIKVAQSTDPAMRAQPFPFTAAGGLSPASFNLAHAQTQIYTGVAPGTYGVTEGTLPPGWDAVTYDVSTGDPHDALVLTAGADVVVAVTNVPCATAPTEAGCWGDESVPPQVQFVDNTQNGNTQAGAWGGAFTVDDLQIGLIDPEGSR